MKQRMITGVVVGTFGAALGALARSPRDRRGRGAVDRTTDAPPGSPTDAVPVDAVTGLPNAGYFDIAATGRITAARRHLWPVTVVILEVTFGNDARTSVTRSAAVAAFADRLRHTLREADIACRLGPDRFGLVLEDTHEEGAIWTVERIQMALARDAAVVAAVSAGLATYPTHGLEPADVITRAHDALRRARATDPGRGPGPVEVATTDG